MNYDFSQKRHWRRSLWNCIADRVQTPKRDALVLYLAGALDEDRPVAIAKGFRGSNMIAIEHKQEAAMQLRSRGTLTLVGDAFEHALAWNHKRPVDVCVLDLCGGLTQRTAASIEVMLALPHFRRTVVAVNMLRGRDSTGNRLSSALIRLNTKTREEVGGGDDPLSVKLGLVSRDEFAARLIKHLGADHDKHRGVLLQSLILRNWMTNCLMATGVISRYGDLETSTTQDSDQRIEARQRVWLAFQSAKFQTLTYRSIANQTFDTLVFRNSLEAGGVVIEPEATSTYRSDPGLLRHKQQQAAILAHRTRRMSR